MTDTTSLYTTSEIWLTILKSFAMLAIVLAVLIGILFLIKKLMTVRGNYTEKNLIRILSSFYVAPKERIILVDVLDEKLLLGVTPQNITCLAKLSNDKEIETFNIQPANNIFSNLLNRYIKKDSINNREDEESSQ